MNLASMIVALALVGQAVDIQELSTEVVGVWNLELADVDQEQKTVHVIVGRAHDELLAWYLGDEGLKSCSDVRIENDTLYMSATPNESDETLHAKLQASLVDANICSGIIEYDGSNIDFTGKRLKAETLGKIHEWKLEFTTPDWVQRTPTIKAVEREDKLYGWYSSEEYEIPAMKLTKQADQIVMEISTKTEEGEDIRVVFQGTTQGDRVSGQAKWELDYDSGSFEFTGQRNN